MSQEPEAGSSLGLGGMQLRSRLFAWGHEAAGNQLVMRTAATRAGRSFQEGNVPTASGRASASMVAAGWAHALHSPPAPRDSPPQPEHRNLGD